MGAPAEAARLGQRAPVDRAVGLPALLGRATQALADQLIEAAARLGLERQVTGGQTEVDDQVAVLPAQRLATVHAEVRPARILGAAACAGHPSALHEVVRSSDLAGKMRAT